MIKFLFLIFLFSYSFSIYPILLIHGIGNYCTKSDTSYIINKLSSSLNTSVECIEIGNGFFSSWFQNFENQAEELCSKLKVHPTFQDKFSIMGISQGTLLGRYLIQKCDIKGKIINYLSFDGPQQGIGYIPKLTCGFLCDWINYLTVDLIYSLNDYLSPSSYYKYKYDIQKYYKYNKFLLDLNNEGEIKNETYKEKIIKLNKVMLVKGNKDTVISPKESSWFEFYDEKGQNIIPLNESKFYIDDFIGIRYLNENQKIDFVLFSGEHVKFTEEEFQVFINFFKNNN